MILNRYERMLARRYLLPGKGEGFIFVVAGFSIGAVTLGVAALIIVMSVMNGFRAELFDKIVGLNGHAVVTGYDNRLSNWQQIADAAPVDLDEFFRIDDTGDRFHRAIDDRQLFLPGQARGAHVSILATWRHAPKTAAVQFNLDYCKLAVSKRARIADC